MSPSSRLTAIAAELRELEERRTRLLVEQADLVGRETERFPLSSADIPSTPSLRTATPLTPDQKIALFLSLFACRTDVHPRRWENLKTGRAGYSPACSNE